jgi:hypothetical protein
MEYIELGVPDENLFFEPPFAVYYFAGLIRINRCRLHRRAGG